MNKRRRLGGVLVAILASVVAGATALPAHAVSLTDPAIDPCTSLPGNLVANCGFEALASGGVVPGWTHLVSHGSNQTTSEAHSGARSLRFASTSRDDVWTQTIAVAPNTSYLVGAEFFSDANSGTPSDDIELTATNVIGSPGAGDVIYFSTNTAYSWNRGAEVVKTGSGHTMTLTLSGANVPGQDYVDDVFAIAQRSGCAAVANNLVSNCGFEAATASPWQNSVHQDSQVTSGFNGGNGGSMGLRLASSTVNDVWNQTIAVRPHTQYTLTYWVQYWSDDIAPDNNLTVSVSNVPGSMNITTTDVPNRFWAPVTRTFTTGAGTTATLKISGGNHPQETNVDDFSVTATSHVKVSAKGRKLTTTLTGLGGQKVLLERLVHNHWITVHSFTAPRTGSSKSWKLSVAKGKYRAVAQSAPGYVSATSAAITVH